MIAVPLGLITFSEIGYILGVAVIIFGVAAVWQNPFIGFSQKFLWIFTILLLNWVGLLIYYYLFYIRPGKK